MVVEILRIAPPCWEVTQARFERDLPVVDPVLKHGLEGWVAHVIRSLFDSLIIDHVDEHACVDGRESVSKSCNTC